MGVFLRDFLVGVCGVFKIFTFFSIKEAEILLFPYHLLLVPKFHLVILVVKWSRLSYVRQGFDIGVSVLAAGILVHLHLPAGRYRQYT